VRSFATALVTASTLVLTLTAASTNRGLTVTPRLTVAAALQPSGCVGWCMFCDLGEEKYIVMPSEFVKNDPDNQVDCGHHVPCPMDCVVSLHDDMRTLTRVLAANRDSELRALLRRFPRAEVNTRRTALQLRGCNDTAVVAHIPLTRQQLELVGAAASLSERLAGATGKPIPAFMEPPRAEMRRREFTLVR
jgi:hypothetical protein